jgi:DNA-binding MarR family transcriptional regulator
MIRKSNYSKMELLAAIGQRVQGFQDATDEVDEAVARRLRLNRTDLRCLSVLSQAGAMSASALADAAGLSRGAMTTALDRIEAAGYARRVWDQRDRRALRVEMTDAAKQEVEVLYGPLAKAGFELLQKYTTQQLEAVLRYLEDGRQLQRAQAQRIRALGAPAAASARLVRGRRGRAAKRS